MNRRTWIGLVGLSALLGACQTVPPASVPATVNQATAQTAQYTYYRHQVIVKYDTETALLHATQSVGAKMLDRIPELNLALLEVNRDALKVRADLVQTAGIAGAWPNTLTGAHAPARKGGQVPELGQLSNTNAQQVFDELPQFALDEYHLNAKAAWEAGLTGKGAIVAILDDPADVTHPDLLPNWAGVAYDPAQNKVYTSAEEWSKYWASDYASHGTFVASAAVSPRDGKGIVGVAPEAKFIPVAFNPARKQTNEFYDDFLLAKSVVWVTNQGARVLNNSWGGGQHWGALKQAYDYAMGKGAVVVASMGNSSQDERSQPATLPGILASGALDARNAKVVFSTSGRHISSAAPGESVLLANPTWAWTANGRGDDSRPEEQSRYQLISGTSFSAPYTAGVAALVLGKCPKATPFQVKRVIEMNADASIGSNPNGWDRETGWGRVNAGAIAQNLNCEALPAKGATVKVKVSYYTEKGVQKGELANVLLRSKTVQENNPNDPSPIYMAATLDSGEVLFSEIEPGEYDIYVAGPNTYETGFLNKDRGTYVGSLSAPSGTSYDEPALYQVAMQTAYLDYNPYDPYEPNDVIADAKPIDYGETSQVAYIFGKPKDVDLFSFKGMAGDVIQADVLASGRLGSKMDSFLFLYDTDGKTVLASNDDRGTPRIDQDSQITFTLPKDGTYYLHVSTCNISCDPKDSKPDNSPFNRYRLQLAKLNK